jgi:hypothetical protein
VGKDFEICLKASRSFNYGRQPGTQLVEGWQLRRAVQGSSRRDGAIVELTVDKSSVAGYSPDGNDVITEDVESPLLESVARERLLKSQQAGRRPSERCCDL